MNITFIFLVVPYVISKPSPKLTYIHQTPCIEINYTYWLFIKLRIKYPPIKHIYKPVPTLIFHRSEISRCWIPVLNPLHTWNSSHTRKPWFSASAPHSPPVSSRYVACFNFSVSIWGKSSCAEDGCQANGCIPLLAAGVAVASVPFCILSTYLHSRWPHWYYLRCLNA